MVVKNNSCRTEKPVSKVILKVSLWIPPTDLPASAGDKVTDHGKDIGRTVIFLDFL
jgi:hypothetical protein